MKNLLEQLLPIPKSARKTGGTCFWEAAVSEQLYDNDLGAEAYRLVIEPGKVRIEASGDRGYFLANKTLEQLHLLTGESCPCLEIEDEPDFRVRGYMLDISRCKVPRMDQLFRLVDLLALFKYNQLQLYTEHTFAYLGHEAVWAEASPMTPAQIRELDAYCTHRYIELVPNQNALGHMERWLKHAAYHHLAESPDGFLHPILGWRPSGSVLYPSAESVTFVDGLLEQLLPCFSSNRVHLGCDEPWELGQGRSEERVARIGRHEVFKDYLLKLHALTEKRDKRMLFWSDELRADPSRITELPADVIPVAWGYEADHPFDAECRAFSEAGYTFLVAPGDSSWNSFTSRLDTCLPNIERAAEVALQYEADGLLLTSWGDQGHQQVWPTQLPGILAFASAAWNLSSIKEQPIEQCSLSLATALDHFVFRDNAGEMGKFWIQLARIDSHIPVKIKPLNSSFPYDALYATKPQLRHAAKLLGEERFYIVLGILDSLEKELIKARPDCEDAEWLIEESRLALKLTWFGIKRAQTAGKGEVVQNSLPGWEACMHRFRRVWLRRNREGGLDESMERIAGSHG